MTRNRISEVYGPQMFDITPRCKKCGMQMRDDICLCNAERIIVGGQGRDTADLWGAATIIGALIVIVAVAAVGTFGGWLYLIKR